MQKCGVYVLHRTSSARRANARHNNPGHVEEHTLRGHRTTTHEHPLYQAQSARAIKLSSETFNFPGVCVVLLYTRPEKVVIPIFCPGDFFHRCFWPPCDLSGPRVCPYPTGRTFGDQDDVNDTAVTVTRRSPSATHTHVEKKQTCTSVRITEHSAHVYM